jgi:hypothetical protein
MVTRGAAALQQMPNFGGVATSRGRRSCAMTRHTLIVEGPEGAMTTMELFVDDPAEVWRIGHELFPGRRLAAVNHKDEDELEPGS